VEKALKRGLAGRVCPVFPMHFNPEDGDSIVL